MYIGLAYWILMMIWLIFGLLSHVGYLGAWGGVANVVLLFALFTFLGWRVFGPPLHA